MGNIKVLITKLIWIGQTFLLFLTFSCLSSATCYAYSLTSDTNGAGKETRNFTTGSTITVSCGESLTFSASNRDLGSNGYYHYSFVHIVNGREEGAGSCAIYGRSYGDDMYHDSTTLINKANSSSAGVYKWCVEYKQSLYPKNYYTFLTVNVRHNYALKSDAAPSCTETGRKHYQCSCGESYEETYGTANGHSILPEIQEEGYFRQYCNNCNQVLEETPITYYLSYDGAGATIGTMPEMTCRYGEMITLDPNQYDKIGYEFGGWKFDGRIYEDCETVKNLTTESGGMVTLSALWMPRPYTITFDSMGGNRVPDITQDYNSKLGRLPKPERVGYTFIGWFDKNGELELTEDSLMPLDGAVYFAQWKPNKYKLYFDITSGDELHGEDYKTIIYETCYGVLPIPTKADHIFCGWYTENGEIGQATPDEAQKATNENAEKASVSQAQKEEAIEYTDEKISTESEAEVATESNSAIEESENILASSSAAGLQRDSAAQTVWGAYSKKITKILRIPITSNIVSKAVHENQAWGSLITGDTICTIADDHSVFAKWKFVADDNGNGTNVRPGQDGIQGNEDDTYYWNGEDGIPGTTDDKRIDPGQDEIYGTADDFYINDDGEKVFAGIDCVFGTPDDYIDNKNGTNARPGNDGQFDTADDEIWWNGFDQTPGNQDDKQIYPGADHIWGTEDDFADNEDGTNIRPGSDGIWGTTDDETWRNGEDSIPGTDDDIKVQGSGKSTVTDESHVSMVDMSGWEYTQRGWRYYDKYRNPLREQWAFLYYEPTKRSDWYHFDAEGYMQTGWYQDGTGAVYFLHTVPDGTRGHMYTGEEKIDEIIYCFDLDNGKLVNKSPAAE